MSTVVRSVLAILLPLRHYEAMTGWLNVVNAVPYIGVGFIIASEWYKDLHWHWWLISGVGLIAILAAHGIYHLQRKVDRLLEFDEAIRYLRETQLELDRVVNNMVATRYASSHPRPGTEVDDDAWGGHLHDVEEQWESEGLVILADLVKYGRSHPLVGRRIQ